MRRWFKIATCGTISEHNTIQNRLRPQNCSNGFVLMIYFGLTLRGCVFFFSASSQCGHRVTTKPFASGFVHRPGLTGPGPLCKSTQGAWVGPYAKCKGHALPLSLAQRTRPPKKIQFGGAHEILSLGVCCWGLLCRRSYRTWRTTPWLFKAKPARCWDY